MAINGFYLMGFVSYLPIHLPPWPVSQHGYPGAHHPHTPIPHPPKDLPHPHLPLLPKSRNGLILHLLLLLGVLLQSHLQQVERRPTSLHERSLKVVRAVEERLAQGGQPQPWPAISNCNKSQIDINKIYRIEYQ